MKTVADMREVAKRMEITGVSRLNKSELSAVIREGIEQAHSEALSENDLFNARKILAPEPYYSVPAGKGYNVRMHNRMVGYLTQNGHAAKLLTPEYGPFDTPMMASFLTPAQRRRVAKKRNRQYS